jgi:hypothetical protein
LNWEENDKKVETVLKESIKQKRALQITDKEQLMTWISNLKQSVKFEDNYTFTRQLQRELSDGSRIQFIWNKSDKWQTIALSLDKKYKSSQWFNAEDGSVINNSNASKISYQLPPYGTVILNASTKNSLENTISKAVNLNPNNAETAVNIEYWDISADTLHITNTKLFDFKTHEIFKNVGSEISYKSSFELNSLNSKTSYLLDLGKVYHTAEVFINGKLAGKRIFAPYSLEISQFLQKGKNDIEIRVLPTKLNYFIGQALAENKHYKQFKKGQLMSNGLVGEVKILEIK